MREDIIAIVCPDIHGRKFWKEVAEEYDGSVPFIFLGDYLDPYPHEGITAEDAKNNFDELWEFVKKWDKQVITLLGNHDMSYYNKHFRCCRYSSSNATWYGEFLRKNWEHFNICFQIENRGKTFLMSHAGVHPQWLTQNDIDPNWSADFINSQFANRELEFSDYSYYRGGSYWETGSPIWADIREFDDFIKHGDKSIALPRNVKQIVGHTQLEHGMVDLGDICCIDSRQVFVITKDNKIEPYKRKED